MRSVLVGLCLSLSCLLACGGGDSNDTTSGGSTGTGTTASTNSGTTASTNSGTTADTSSSTTANTSSSTTANTSSSTTGQSCSGPGQCANVPCACNDGAIINYSGCDNGVCATGAAACNPACEDHNGWSGQGTTGTSGTTSTTTTTTTGTSGTTGHTDPGVGQPCVAPDFACASGLICVVHNQSDQQGLCSRACDSNDTFSCDQYESEDNASYSCCALGNGTGACQAFGSCN